MSLWDGIGAVVGKITQWIPGRIESLKNEKNRLQREYDGLTIMPYTKDRSRRIDFITNRLRDINSKLENSASN